MGNIGIWQLLIVAVIIILLFGTKKLRTLGSDLGSSVKGFKKAIANDDDKKSADTQDINDSIVNKESAESESKNKEQV